MKNLQTFTEFINEGYANRVGGEVQYLMGDEDYMDDVYKKAADALGVGINGLYAMDSETEDSRELQALPSAEKAYQKGPVTNVKVDGGSLSVNKKAGIAKYDDNGYELFIFHNKSKF
jgi:hypothetical protein